MLQPGTLYSKEQRQWEGSYEHPEYIFELTNQKMFTLKLFWPSGLMLICYISFAMRH